ncbi:hypothetical protein HN51_038401 [Arachis hypogaea]|uniref:uncharacterized protein n=1 Tax=Arachis hypogaea TaxID=3818 RepID=UPI000DEC0FF9|nr:uncharacterized protein LOC112792579 [Arachis hypogaea]XP_025691660.1 uncharacterized protein LOC112792581 [Arachis hypogaea]
MPTSILPSQNGNTRTTKMSSRQRPLHACGVSMIAMAEIAIGKTQNVNGPLGANLRRIIAKLSRSTTPLIYAMQCQLLAILSFMDDHIITAEKISEKVFPSSAVAFDKVDELVLIIASMPEKFDGAVNKVLAVIHKVPLLERAMTLFISMLNGFASILDHYWGRGDSIRTKEKTIGVDSSSSSGYISLENFPPILEAEIKGTHDKKAAAVLPSCAKGSYKQALLESGNKERNNPHDDDDEKEVDGGELCEVSEEGEKKQDDRRSEVEENDKCESNKGGDVLLKLFDSWLMNPGRF